MKEYVLKLSDIERIELLNSFSKNLRRLKKNMDKSLKAEIEAHTHVSRAKSTTLYANSVKNTEMYNKQIEDIKILAKLL